MAALYTYSDGNKPNLEPLQSRPEPVQIKAIEVRPCSSRPIDEEQLKQGAECEARRRGIKHMLAIAFPAGPPAHPGAYAGHGGNNDYIRCNCHRHQTGRPSLARRLAAAGMGVAIIERGLFGGTWVNTGCTPTKTMVASARAARIARRAAEFGVSIAGPVGVDMKRVKASKGCGG